MFTRMIVVAMLFTLVLLSPAYAQRKVRLGDAAEFPPGLFSDGGQYRLEDFKGKVLVLYFYEQDCPSCRGMVPKRNQLVESYKGKPVKFIAVGPRDSAKDVNAYAKDTRLVMPIFADALGVMETRYGEEISLRNISQFKVIGPDGKIIGFTEAAISRAVEGAKWKYKDSGYNPKLAGAIELFEWNQFEAGMKLLKPQLKSSDKALAESAQKLFAEIKAEGEEWKTSAESSAESEPVMAHDLYTKLSTVFAGEELGKSADDALKKLKAQQQVKDELSARKAWLDLPKAMSTATLAQKSQVIQFCQNLAKKYLNTPTAAKATALADEISTLPAKQ